jgi:hypothetical protein
MSFIYIHTLHFIAVRCCCITRSCSKKRNLTWPPGMLGVSSRVGFYLESGVFRKSLRHNHPRKMSSFFAVASPILSGVAARSAVKAPSPRARHQTRLASKPRALPMDLIAEVADKAAYGSVDAPIGAIVGGAVVVTALMLGISWGLKPGIEASEKMQARDKKKFNK